MAKERYIKIDEGYYPIDGFLWRSGWNLDVREVRGFEVGSEDNEPLIIVFGDEASHLINLLDDLSLDVSLLREEEHNG